MDNSYHIDNNVLPEVTSCRDLGVTITNDLSPTLHINEIVRKAHQRANAILRCFVIRDNVLLVNALKTYVRPIVEYNSVVWFPHLKRDIDHIETVQRRFTKSSSE